MKTTAKAFLILFVAGGVLLATQEQPRLYVERCICGICSYLFGN